MRSRAASPFQLGDLRRIARICRWCGVRSYLALNVIVYDDELETVREICAAAKAACIDAVIASDIAAIEQARSAGLEVHISVQANVSNMGAVRFFARYADVMVLARELTLEQITAIGNAIREEGITGPSGELVQIELFAHGALCVAISGKCHMSLGVYNQSASRGACFQNCRRQYRVTDVETGDELEIQNRYVMSPKDLCTLPHLDKLADAGVCLGNQSVLLRGVNDDARVMKAHVQKLLICRVRPYYIYQCDLVTGSAHFRTSIDTGLEIIRAIQGHTTGYAVPHYVVDTPNGGKIPLHPQCVVRRKGGKTLLRNSEGKLIEYPKPSRAEPTGPLDPLRMAHTVS